MVSPGAEPAEGAPCSAALAVLLAFFGSALVLMLEFWERLGSKVGCAHVPPPQPWISTTVLLPDLC